MMTGEDIVNAANELKAIAIELMVSLISWRSGPIICNRGEAEKARINGMRERLSLLTLPRYKKAAKVILRNTYNDFKMLDHDIPLRSLPNECPYTVKQFLDPNYFPKIATSTPNSLITTTQAA